MNGMLRFPAWARPYYIALVTLATSNTTKHIPTKYLRRHSPNKRHNHILHLFGREEDHFGSKRRSFHFYCLYNAVVCCSTKQKKSRIKGDFLNRFAFCTFPILLYCMCPLFRLSLYVAKHCHFNCTGNMNFRGKTPQRSSTALTSHIFQDISQKLIPSSLL